tara:strand:+ start:52 stop:180 length:129 start_codon:yes stop_codon:yes gene_type:complete
MKRCPKCGYTKTIEPKFPEFKNWNKFMNKTLKKMVKGDIDAG